MCEIFRPCSKLLGHVEIVIIKKIHHLINATLLCIKCILYRMSHCDVYFSDKLSRACKIRDEYSLVKDLVQERDRKRLAVAPVTAPYGNASDDSRKGTGIS